MDFNHTVTDKVHRRTTAPTIGSMCWEEAIVFRLAIANFLKKYRSATRSTNPHTQRSAQGVVISIAQGKYTLLMRDNASMEGGMGGKPAPQDGETHVHLRAIEERQVDHREEEGPRKVHEP